MLKPVHDNRGHDDGNPFRSGRMAPEGTGHRPMMSLLRPFVLLAGLAVILPAASCALPRWPVEGPVSSPFGLRMVGIRPQIHRGVDLAVPQGTRVSAMTGGRVSHAGPLGGYGITVIIEHPLGWSTLYAHLAEVRVRPGQRVRARQIIGMSGQTGAARGAHLHFEIRRHGKAMDPVPLLGGPPRP